ncbi:alpha/beta hydrolase [Frateuria sp. Soil773]|uniref:alpha/beta hydrolase family protein n=1 Tax=Frateuria sp. Soil773 TaxID=1736407 RepID=UPI0006FA9766|nr:alpha/beta fold hydrolase [Frateuria sp. Soil773]KRE92485.1 alpha/beta hydrolase [Frateuria sp. Soil773]
MPPSGSDPSPCVPQVLPVLAADGAASELMLLRPAGEARRLLYWLPAMGMPARHYLALAESLAARGVAVALHEWRGIGSSNRRAGRRQDWGYRELLELDLPAGLAVARQQLPQADCWLGGHSLGGQLAALHAALHPAQAAGLALVASGAPYWRCFAHAGLVRMAYVAAPWLAALCGHLPGRRIGFGGNEARGVIRDWSRSGRTGVYRAERMAVGLERAMAGVDLPLLALRMRDDWLGPAASLEWLLSKMPRTRRTLDVLSPQELAGRADHFGWMKAPAPVAARIAGWMDGQAGPAS